MLGPNGAGKSTLLRALAGLTRRRGLDRRRPASRSTGRATGVRAAERRRVGLVFQNYRLFPHLSVLDNVAFAPGPRGEPPAPSHELGRRL